MIQHALTPRASKMGLIAACPGALPLSAEVPEDYARAEPEMAAMGTRLHAHLAAPDPIAAALGAGTADFEMYVVQKAHEWREKRLAEFGARFEVGIVTETEHELPPISLEGLPPELWPTGHADHAAWSEDLLHGMVLDFKLGPSPLERDILAPQMLTYGTGLLEEFPTMLDVEVAAYHALADTEYSEIITRADVDALKARMENVILATQEPAPLFRPSRLACQHCPASVLCAVAHREVRHMIHWSARPLADRSPEERTHFVDMCKLARSTSEAGLDAAKELMRATPDSIPGWRLKERQVRVIDRPDSVAIAIESWVSAADLLATSRPSITKLEAVFSDHYTAKDGGTKKDAKQVLSKLIEPFLGRETSYILERDPEFKAIANTNGDTPK